MLQSRFSINLLALVVVVVVVVVAIVEVVLLSIVIRRYHRNRERWLFSFVLQRWKIILIIKWAVRLSRCSFTRLSAFDIL